MRLRLLFEKSNPVRFISHLDTMRAFARALRRAGVPLSFSQGFNPHPRISFALPLAVGATSENDVLDLETAEPVDPGMVVRDVNGALPRGFRVTSAREIDPSLPAAMAAVYASEYVARARILDGAGGSRDPADVARMLLETPALIVARGRGDGEGRRVDIRPLVLGISGKPDGGFAVFDMVLRSGSQASVRPDEVLEGLNSLGASWLDLAGARYHRKGILLIEGGKTAPLL